MEKRKDTGGGKPHAALGAVVAFALTIILFSGAIYLWYAGSPSPESGPGPVINQPESEPTDGKEEAGEITRFGSEKEFLSWLAAADIKSQYFGRGLFSVGREAAFDSQESLKAAPSAIGLGAGESAERVSQTNVQVAGIDEPDIIKTDGDEIYYSPQAYHYPVFRGVPEPMVDVEVGSGTSSAESDSAISPRYREPAIKAIDAFPPRDLELDAEIERTGEMLLQDDVLAVFTREGIYAYDVTDPSAPEESWNLKYENNNWPVAQRLMDGSIYVVLSGRIDRGRPCPYVPATSSAQEVSVACGDIWHPVMPVPSDVTYTALKIDMETGQSESQASFVGSRSSSVVYMSPENIYVTHQYPVQAFDFIAGFLNQNDDLVPEYVLDRLNKIAGYDISEQSKMNELRESLGRWMQSLSEDDALQLSNDMENRIDDYYEEHRREIQSTGIVRVSTDDFAVEASGTVPGEPLNQFSLDEYQGNLRIATTVGDSSGMFWQFGFGGGQESVNDVYVLNQELEQVGSALGMGLDERIYAVRFMGERGFVVTFKQIDPFYVLDLSDSANPAIKGELKIPGYSSYLHPVRENLILGVGKEDNQVKLSLFDVSNPDDPQEVSKYMLNEYWSDILSTHHAFLMDEKFEVFFLPGGNGGYIFSYADDELSLAKAVSGISARRAVFLDDYLYVVGDDSVVVLDENDWERINEMDFE